MGVAADKPIWAAFLTFFLATTVQLASGQEIRRDIPAPLEDWQAWATWDDRQRDCPAVFNNAGERICYWPSTLSLEVQPNGGFWRMTVTSFAETWMPLPGSMEIWPQDVTGNGKSMVVIERKRCPNVRLQAGRYELTGKFIWEEMPQKLPIPPAIGVVSLTMADKPIAVPTWDAAGDMWLQRARTEEAEKDQMSVQVYRVIDDGIPIWLRTAIELTVSGKSREEDLGYALPAGWKLATVGSPLPVAINDSGQIKAQVRAGKWVINLDAFRTSDATEIGFAENAQPITSLELIGYRAQPDFRLAEVTGLKPVDVTQTTYPQTWRGIPVYQWNTSEPFQLVEKLRGMAALRPEGLNVGRHFWIDQDGSSLTYRDEIRGKMQQIWRLDAVTSNRLGTVRVDGEGQLITSNPQTGADGVEIRTRNLDLQAIGRVENTKLIDAVGWQTDVDSLGIAMDLPPGWRMLALFGADRVEGDWLQSWSLLDLFLLLIFGLAVTRLWGIPAGLIAFIAFGLAYHEPGSPRLTWLFLLMPVALLKVVPEGTANKWLKVWKFLAVALLLINLVPFLGSQIQSAIYPQLEQSGVSYRPRPMFQPLVRTYQRAASASPAFETDDFAGQQAVPMEKGIAGQQGMVEGKLQARFKSSNLLYDPKARIQTGPAEPQWHWNRVRCVWDGPVKADQQIRPIMLSLNQNRVVTVVRIALLAILAGILIGFRRLPFTRSGRRTATAAILGLCCLAPAGSYAQEIPDQQMLQQLRQRLLEPDDSFPRAAEVAAVELSLQENRVTMTAEIHTATEVAVPLPGKLPDWTPLTVRVGNQAAELVGRRDGYLWVVLPEGVHEVTVEALLPDISEWEWTFLLPPRRVRIDAPGWNVTGVRDNGVPERQVFFVRQQQSKTGEAAYDRKDFSAILAVDRYLETGLIWQVRNEVTRLSKSGKAVSIQVPLLPGERVLSSGVVVEDGKIEVKLAADQEKFSWQSELPLGQEIRLQAAQTDEWVERWHLVASAVWNVTRTGLAPVFESNEENLIPVWHPWPGESVTLTFNRPLAVEGQTVTVRRVNRETTLGRRQRTTELEVDVECSLGTDFRIDLNPVAKISTVRVGGDEKKQFLYDAGALVIPLPPGKRKLEVNYIEDVDLKTVVRVDQVSLPVDTANVTTVVRVPASRWVWWTEGPTRGPAVRFWVILAAALLVALLLGNLQGSPLSRFEWLLLAIGLTQIHVAAALVVVFWLFVLAWRGRADVTNMRRWLFNLQQIGLVLLTLIALGILVVVVGTGLLGHPDMFIVGNGSTRTYLNWFQPRGGSSLPETTIVSVSVWYYRLAMLFWALWLASALLRWLTHGWKQFTHDGGWKRKSATVAVPAEVVPQD